VTPVHFAFAGLVFAGFAALWRLLIGPTLADRIIALDLALIALMAGIAIDGANREDTTWLNLLIVIAIIGFTATVATTRFMEHKGPIDAPDEAESAS
jgi:multicomponent Na+:H+ antiporter subunit F